MSGGDDSSARRCLDDWAGPGGELGSHVAELSQGTLESYRAQSHFVREHAALEQDTARGGYQHRQLFELVQNAADALWSVAHRRSNHDLLAAGDTESERDGAPIPASHHERPAPGAGRIEVHLVEDRLYCADNGEPIDCDGAKALLFSRMSTKRGTGQIGTFGLGFKAVLGVSDSPEFFSRSGSFRFDRMESSRRVREVVPDAEECPVLRLAEPVDPVEFRESDDVLGDLMNWATNIVRLPLMPGAHDDLREQLGNFPAEFLLLVPHVGQLVLTDGSPELNRKLELEKADDDYKLADGDAITQWRVLEHEHLLTIDAHADRRPGDETDKVCIRWAAPIDRLDRSDRFWAFFPTLTPSLVPGVLNAPWKTNEDRQNLLPGTHNDELIGAAAELIADGLPQLATADDPARHLDALPRRRENGDADQAGWLRRRLFAILHNRAIVPDQDGELCDSQSLEYPPEQSIWHRQLGTAALERWEAFPGRPRRWLHHSALTPRRLFAIDRLHDGDGSRRDGSVLPRASVAAWLEALVTHAGPEEAVEASKAAVQTAARIPLDRRRHEDRGARTGSGLGRIVLTAAGRWRRPDPDRLFLPCESPTVGSTMNPESCVHPGLASDSETAEALRELGIEPPSPESRFRLVAERVLTHRRVGTGRYDIQESFWVLSRDLDPTDAHEVIEEHVDWPSRLRARTRTGDWLPLHSVLWPGTIVPGDGSRDDRATVDTEFHGPDEELLRGLGVTAVPGDDRDLSVEREFRRIRDDCRDAFRAQPNLEHIPQRDRLTFRSTRGAGPLAVLGVLSEEARALYTDALLSLDTCCQPWVMRHDLVVACRCPERRCESPTIRAIRRHGRVRTPHGIVPFEEALGRQPASPAALHVLLQHPNAESIRETFGLTEPIPEVFGAEEPRPLTEVWPGLSRHLEPQQRGFSLVCCSQVCVLGESTECKFYEGTVYLADTDSAGFEPQDERRLRLVVEALSLTLSDDDVRAIIEYVTPEEIGRRREQIQALDTDEERLVAAVGVEVLRDGLPDFLLKVMEADGGELTPAEVARAAIAVYGTGTLRYFRANLQDLDPPSKWAGSRRAVDFVSSLGFPDSWAGSPNPRSDPFVDVDGPRSLPRLHDYQQTIVENVRRMIRTDPAEGGRRRGMISLPTGSGKTLVAVQAIVEAIRDGELDGRVLWVAHGNELCEQAVEAWRQVWSNIGPNNVTLRVSRLWGGQEPPRPPGSPDAPHVVVATIQTLRSRPEIAGEPYGFRERVGLVVFDEAHRAIVPEYTDVMRRIGLEPRDGSVEKPVLGLSATPYRGYNEEETARLARRFDGNRLDAGAFERDDAPSVVRELQSRQFLAQADYRTIDGGRVVFDETDLALIQRFVGDTDGEQASSGRIDPGDPDALRRLLAFLPPELERRIAADAERTLRIIDECAALPDDWPVLVFATSVEHAQTVAALLTLRGISARSVSGRTEGADRHQAIEGFRRGEIRVLVNYNVLTEGFDAPQTRAIVVARPVYSPNRYFQMIGRGLRGPLNGGDERCLILNVQDNFGRFGHSLAFPELDWLWGS